MGFEIRYQLWFLLKLEGKISKLTHIAIQKKDVFNNKFAAINYCCSIKIGIKCKFQGKAKDTKCRFLLKNKSHTSTALFTGADFPFTISLAVF